ncbi:MAG: serine/threonine protein kinase, partial [Planctomycetes bacterium]|nr:serine/threonine protein kinase [Planctomycetota bacterium]
MMTKDPSHDAVGNHALALRHELRRRWRLGDRVAIEELLQRDPPLAEDDRVVLELVYTELRLRSRAGESSSLADYASRFSTLGEKLTLLFEIHKALEDLEEPLPWESADSLADDQARAALAQDAAQLDRLVEKFEQAWRTGVPPRIEEFVGENLDEAARRKLLLELIVVDMEYRWSASDGDPSDPADGELAEADAWRPMLLEEYVERWPELGPADRPPLELVVEEFRLRPRCGEGCSADDYVARFPGHGRELHHLLLQVDSEFSHKRTVSTRGATDTNIDTCPPGSQSDEASEAAHSRWHTASLAAGASSPASGDEDLDYDPAPLPYSDFRLIHKIGAGGMGAVYRAVQVSLNKPVAVKILEGVRMRRGRAVQRFLREGRSVAQLRHPNIVDVHGIGRTPNQGYFLVMDLVEGRDLEELLRSKAVTFRDAGLVATVAEAIDHAHRKGVIHRDLKPSNILIDSEGRILVSDFGLAKLLDDHEPSLSLANELLGTPSFMAPEQASRRWGKIGPHTDVYGLGGLLYAVLTGWPPFSGESYTEVLAQVISEDPP